ncbi:MAG TPA: TlpA family protein disulfide reductase [Planctomycetaceae bacterium]|nr:TlpA family protein disulfide reductase [Planctomycetaceae bacterium]
MKNPINLSYFACMLLAAISCGCSEEDVASTPVDAAEDKATVQVVETPLTTMGTWTDIETLIKENRGKVIVVDIWSTYCAPCLKEFPRLLTLQKQHGDKLLCVSFNINYAGLPNQTVETDLPNIHKFLAKQEFQVTNIVSTETDEQVYAQLEIYSIPAILVFDKTGQRIGTVMEEAAYEKTVNPLVAQLIGAQK